MLRANMRLIPDGQIDADVRIHARPVASAWSTLQLLHLSFVMRFFPQTQADTR